MPHRRLNPNELNAIGSGYTQENPYSAPFGGTSQYQGVNERFPVEAIENLTPEELQAFLRAIAPQRPGDSIRDPRFSQQEMIPHSPNLRDRLEMFATDAFGNDPAGRRRQGTFMDTAEILPGAGEMLMFSDAERARQQGDLVTTGILAGGGMLSTIPVVGPVIGKAARRAAQGVGRARNRVSTTGQYVGAPAGVDTPEKLAANRATYMDLVRQGEAGRNWYDGSSNWIEGVTANQKAAQEAANVLGVTSQGTGVDANLGFTVKGINQVAAGFPADTGRFPATAAPLTAKILAGQNPALGPKRDPFAQNLSVAWNPNMAQFPVHDIWDGRAFGYTGKPNAKYPEGRPWDAGFSPQQHAFMDAETDEIIDQFGALGESYDPLSVQAAAWTGKKIDAGELLPQDAAMHYGDYSPKYQASATYEQVPGQGTGHLEGIVNRPFGVRQDYSDLAGWLDPKGRDSLYSSTGMLVEPTRDALGVFTPQGSQVTEFNPANIARPLVQTSGNVLPPDKALLSTTEAARAYVDAQNAGAWNRVIPDGQTSAGERTSLQINTGRRVTQEELTQINDVATKAGYFAIDNGDNTIRLINDEFDVLGNGRGSQRALEMSKPRQRFGKDDAERMAENISAIVGDSNVTRAKIESDFIDFETNLQKSMEGSGAATEQLFEILDNNPTIRDSIEADAMAKAQANLTRDARFGEANKLPVRGDIQNARQILAEGGWDALRQAYLRKEFVPAIIGAILAPSFFGMSVMLEDQGV